VGNTRDVGRASETQRRLEWTLVVLVYAAVLGAIAIGVYSAIVRSWLGIGASFTLLAIAGIGFWTEARARRGKPEHWLSELVWAGIGINALGAGFGRWGVVAGGALVGLYLLASVGERITSRTPPRDSPGSPSP
jgi:uncharacterized membrane protein YczE